MRSQTRYKSQTFYYNTIDREITSIKRAEQSEAIQLITINWENLTAHTTTISAVK